MITSEYYGPSTSNSPGEKGWEEKQGQQNLLHQQTCEDTGSDERKRERIIYIENSAINHKAFVIEEVNTVEEVTQKVCKRYPEICLNAFGFRISNSRNGTTGRKYFTDKIPYTYDTLYISLYLRKH